MSGSVCTSTFSDAAGAAVSKAGRAPPPFSIRLTSEERARLNRDAGDMALSAYVRQKLFGDDAAAREARYLRKQRRPMMDHATVARLLGALGRSELATSMTALAAAAQSGAVPVTPELMDKLDAACDDICQMRAALIVALRVKPERDQ